MKQLKIQINKPVRGYKSGSIISINVDNAKIPLDKYWRMRFKEAKIDNCVKVVIEPKAYESKQKNK